MKEKVRKAAKDLNYKHNSYAANLRMGISKTIGVIVPHINKSFFSELIAGIEEICFEHDYGLIICQSQESYEKECRAIDTLIRQNVDGILISVSAETNSSECWQGLLALLQHRVVIAVFVLHGNSGGHHQALSQRAVCDAALGELVLPDVLLHQSGDPGDLGSRHGSTAHELVLIRLLGCTIDRVNRAARGGDFRLQAQVARHTPGAELADGVVRRIVDGNRKLLAIP